MARLDRELRQDRVAEGFGGDAGAVGDEEDGAVGHGAACPSGRRAAGHRRSWREHPPRIAARLFRMPPPCTSRPPRLAASATRASARWPRHAASRRSGGSTGFSPSRSFPMSSTHLATALVVPFEQLRMTDVEAVGGKNASPRRNDQPAGRLRRARARRLRHHGARVPRVPRATTAWPSASTSGSPRWTPTTCARSPRPAPRSAAGSRRSRFPPALEAAIRSRVRAARRRPPEAQLRRALVGHRRGPARRVVRRPAGDLPQRRRHRRRAAQDARGLRLASTTTAPSATACTRASRTPTSRCRPACSAWCAPTSARPA